MGYYGTPQPMNQFTDPNSTTVFCPLTFRICYRGWAPLALPGFRGDYL